MSIRIFKIGIYAAVSLVCSKKIMINDTSGSDGVDYHDVLPHATVLNLVSFLSHPRPQLVNIPRPQCESDRMIHLKKN